MALSQGLQPAQEEDAASRGCSHPAPGGPWLLTSDLRHLPTPLLLQTLRPLGEGETCMPTLVEPGDRSHEPLALSGLERGCDAIRPVPSLLPKVVQVWGGGAIGPVPSPQEGMLTGAPRGSSWCKGSHSFLCPAQHWPVPHCPSSGTPGKCACRAGRGATTACAFLG